MDKINAIITDLNFRNAYLRQILKDLSHVISKEEINGLLDEIKKNENLIEIFEQAKEN